MDGVGDVALGLLKHLRLSETQAAVLLDASVTPSKLLLYVFDKTVAARSLAVSVWAGMPVEVIRSKPFKPH